MTWTRRWFACLLLASSVALGTLAQPDVPLAEPDPLLPILVLPTERGQAKRLDAAVEYLRAEEYPLALRQVQIVLDASDDHLTRPRDGKESWQSIRQRAERILEGLNPTARDAYRTLYEPQARPLLDQARRKMDPLLLAETVRRFRFTPSGEDALILLAGYYQDRGQVPAAARCYRELLGVSSAEKQSVPVLVRATLAFRTLGIASLAETTWQILQRRANNGKITLGGRDFALADLDKSLTPVASRVLAQGDSRLYRGDAQRNAGHASQPPLLEPFAQIETTALPQGKDLLVRAWGQRSDGLPEGHPVGVGRRVVFRTALGVAALDVTTGQKAWETPLEFSVEGLLRDPQRKQQLLHWATRYYKDGPLNLLVENGVNGTLSADDQRVYAIDGLAMPVPPVLMLEVANGVRPALFSTLKNWLVSNRLRAFDLATGKPTWQIGGPAGTTAPEFAGALFLGPPLPLDGFLWVLAQKQQTLMLHALDPATGAWRFTQPIGNVGDKIEMNLIRRCSAVHLAAADGLLIVPTHHGAVVAFDPLARRLAWAHTYADRPALNWENADPQLSQLREMWRNSFQGSVPLIAEGRVVLSGPDTQVIRCLHLEEGRLLWTHPMQPGDQFVATIHKGAVLIVGRDSCRAVNLGDGKLLWQHAISAPSGQGVRCEGTYWLPVRAGGLLGIDLESGKPPVRLGEQGSPVLGNLLVHAGVFWAQDTFRILGYPDVTKRLLALDELLLVNPDNHPARLERANLRLSQNQAREAIGDLRSLLARANLDTAFRPKARGMLTNALTQELRRDPARTNALVPEYLALSKSPPPPDVAVLVARSHAAVGRHREAAEQILAALPMVSPEPVPHPEDSQLQTRAEVQLERTLRQMHAEASPTGRLAIQTVLGQQARAPTGPGGSETLFRLVSLADLLTPSDRLALLGRLIQTPMPVGRLLLRLESVESRLTAPEDVAAVLRLRADLFIRAGLTEDGARCFRRLGAEFATTQVHEGRTGAQLLAEARQDRRLLSVFEAPAEWNVARWSAREERGPCRPPLSPLLRLTDDHNFGFETGSAPQDEPLRVTREPGVLARTLRLAFDPGKSSIAIQNAAGETLWTVPAARSFLDPIIAGEPRGGYVILGSLALVQVNNHAYGLDLVERKILWSQRLIEPCKNPGAAFPGLTVSLQGRLEASSPERNQWSLRVGFGGELTPTRVLLHLRDSLVALDPWTGLPIWKRNVLAPATLAGDSTRVLLLQGDPGETVPRPVLALRMEDGRSLPFAPGTLDTLRNQPRLCFLGSDLLLWENDGGDGKRRLRRFDPVAGTDRWVRTLPSTTAWLLTPELNTLGMSTKPSEVRLLDLTTGKDRGPVFSLGTGKLDSNETHYVLSDERHWYVVARTPYAEQGLAGDPSYHLAMTVPVMLAGGQLYAFERGSGRLAWRADMPGQVLARDPLEAFPFLIGVADVTTAGEPPTGQRRYIRVRILEKATGKVLFKHDEWLRDDATNPIRTPYLEMFHTPRYDPQTGWLELSGPAVRIRLEGKR